MLPRVTQKLDCGTRVGQGKEENTEVYIKTRISSWKSYM